MLNSDPSRDLRGALKGREVKHHARLSESELPDFLEKIDGYSGAPVTRLAIRLLLPPVRGWRKLYELATSLNPNCLVVMNEVQWGSHPDMPAEAKPETTRTANTLLRTFYRTAAGVSGDRVRPLAYDPSLFSPDPQHKWGIGLFHYKGDLYHTTIRHLTRIVDQSDQKSPT